MEQPLLSLPGELLGEILSFLQAKDTSSLSSTSKKWSNLTWTKIAHLDIPDQFTNPLIIFKKCDPKALPSLALDLTDDAIVSKSLAYADFAQTLATFKCLTQLRLYAPKPEKIALYDALYQLTQLKILELTDNGLDDAQQLTRLPTLRKLTDLSITVENCNFAPLPIEELTFLSTLKFPFSDGLDDHCLDRILTLTQLEFLDLTWCGQITHNSFSKIVKMKSLTKLDLSRCMKIMAPSFELLAELPRLWSLDLSYHHALGTKEIEVLSRNPHITCLYLVANNALRIDSLDCIARMNNLRELHLEGRDCSLAQLTSLTNLRTLDTNFKTDRPTIALLTHLEYLNLNEPQSKDADWLCTMTWLKQLGIANDSFGQESANKVTKALLHTVVLLPAQLNKI